MANIIDNTIEFKKKYLDSIKLTLTDELNKIIEEYHQKALNIHVNNNATVSFFNEMDNWLYTTYFVCSVLLNGCLSFKCIETDNIITSTYSSFIEPFGDKNCKVMYYYFPNGENTFVLLFGAIYNLPIGVYYLKSNNYYRLCWGSYGGVYAAEYALITEFFIPKFDESKAKVENNISKKKIIFFGYNFQPGHYLWNEVSGIYILLKTGLVNNIDTLVVGDWDMYNLHKIIKKNNPKCNIVLFDDFVSQNDLENNIYSKIGDSFILDETKHLVINSVVDYFQYPSDKFNFLVNLKLDKRGLKNTLEIYAQIINKLVEENFVKPDKLFLIFEGLYLNDNEGSRTYYNTYSSKYIDGIQYLKDNIHPDIKSMSLIGEKAMDIIKYCKNIDYFIGNVCSNTDILKWIFRKPGCLFTFNEYEAIDGLNKYYMDGLVNYNISYGPIIDHENCIFEIDFDVLYKEVSSYFINNASDLNKFTLEQEVTEEQRSPEACDLTEVQDVTEVQGK